jgi:uncharacterized protein
MKYFFTVLFLIFALLIYFGIQYYSMYRLFGFFSRNFNVLWIALIVTIIYPLATIIDRLFHSMPTRIMYFAVSSLAGFLFILFFLLILLEIGNLFYPLFTSHIAGIILIILVIISGAFAIINASKIYVEEITIENFGENLDVVQLSDVHIGTLRDSNFLNKVIKKTNSLNPDLVFITGDLVDGSGKLSNNTFSPLNKLKSSTYIIMGNHEFYEGENQVINYMVDANVTILRNKAVTAKGINVIGLDYSGDKNYVERQLKKLMLNNSKQTILLNHVPVGFESAEKYGVDLMLSGHTHNGQIFPFTLLVKLFFPKINGMYDVGNMKLYVSSGTGTWGPPMRLGSRNKIILFHLKK